METLEPLKSASSNTEPDLMLLRDHDQASDWRQWRAAALGSLGFHIALILVVLSMPQNNGRVYQSPAIVRVTPIFTPTQLTQKDPNKGKISKELTVESIAPRPVVKAPSPAATAKRVPPPAPVTVTPPQVARVEPKPVVIEPPKIQSETSNTDQPQQIAKLTPPPPPPPVEQPKLVLEEVAPPPKSPTQGKAAGAIAIPNPSVQEAVRNLARGGSQNGQSVGDTGVDEAGVGSPLNLPPSAGRPRSNLELKSDPMGVDFKPYMLQVLAAVRRNWFAVYPEAARLGQRGEVVLEFAIAKPGTVAKVIFSTESGAKALDQSAVAAISASNPLPPLPAEFRGDRIVLRMTFMYNMQR
jgi:TonB family protein